MSLLKVTFPCLFRWSDGLPLRESAGGPAGLPARRLVSPHVTRSLSGIPMPTIEGLPTGKPGTIQSGEPINVSMNCPVTYYSAVTVPANLYPRRANVSHTNVTLFCCFRFFVKAPHDLYMLKAKRDYPSPPPPPFFSFFFKI